MKATAILAAAGSGERLGADVPKAFVELAGRPMLEWSLDALAAAESVGEVLVTVPPTTGTVPSVPRVKDVTLGSDPNVTEVTVVEGGPSRSESVRNALERVESELVVVHDAARPLASAALFDEVLAALEGDPDAAGIVAAAPVTDTTKEVRSGREVERTLDRSTLWSAQTPQAFRTAALRAALASTELLAQASDDAMLVEANGGRVLILPAPPSNLKVTTPLGLQLAEALLRDRG